MHCLYLVACFHRDNHRRNWAKCRFADPDHSTHYPSSGSGASSGDPVSVVSGQEAYIPEPDLVVYNPNGPDVVFQRNFRSGGASIITALPRNWIHNYSGYIAGSGNSWGNVTFVFPNGASETFTPQLNNGTPTGDFSVSNTKDWFLKGSASSTNVGWWDSLTAQWRDGTQWIFTKVPYYDRYWLSEIKDSNGKSLTLTWDTAYTNRLLSVKETGTSNVLLSLTYSTNAITLTDCYNRKVVLSLGSVTGLSGNQLLSVSQIVDAATTTPPARATYGYISDNGAPMLSSITVPSATGTGTDTCTLAWAGGRVASLTDANGYQHVFTYEPTYTTVKRKNAAGQVVAQWTRPFDSSGRDTGARDANNKGATILYEDTAHPRKPTQVTDADGVWVKYTYDAWGNTTKVETPRHTVNSTYDYNVNLPFGRVTQVQEVGRGAVSYTYYETSGLVQSITSPNPTGTGTITTSFTYNALGDVLTIVAPDSTGTAQTTTLNYTQDGLYSQTAKAGQPLKVTNPLGHVVPFRYDARGNITTQTDVANNTTTHVYNLADQVTSSTLPSVVQSNGTWNTSIARNYRYPGGILYQVAQTGQAAPMQPVVTTVNYDWGKEGELLKVWGSQQPVTYEYDALYRLSKIQDGRNNATTYQYDSVGNLSLVTYPDTKTIQYPAYSDAGRLRQQIDPRGIVANYAYNDSEKLLTSISFPTYSAHNQTFAYDAFGRLQTRTDATGSTVYGYNGLDLLTGVTTTYTGLSAKAIGYTYNPDGSRAQMTTPAGNFAYTYNSIGQLTHLLAPNSQNYDWIYDSVGRLQKQILSSGIYTRYSYDALGRVQTLKHQQFIEDENTPYLWTMATYGLEYDGAGRRSKLTSTLNPSSWQVGNQTVSYNGTTTYQYDSWGQLTQESSTRKPSGYPNGYTFTYTYDNSGNPTIWRGTSLPSSNTNNQTTATGYGYDFAGNPTTYNSSTLTFDPFSQMTSFGSALSAGYNGDGLRAWRQTSNGRTYSLYDGMTPVVKLDGSGNVSGWQVWGANGLLATKRGSTSREYLWDVQGGLSFLMDGGLSVQAMAMWEAWGSGDSSAALTEAEATYGGQWGYVKDGETGLLLLGHRYYDPTTGRFINRDPIGYDGGINLYSYTENDPVNGIDPTGYSAFTSADEGLALLNAYQAGSTFLDSCSSSSDKIWAIAGIIPFAKFRPGGLKIWREGDYWYKAVDTSKSKLTQWYARKTLKAQAKALERLGDMAPEFDLADDVLKTQDVGKFNGSALDFIKTKFKGSVRLRTPFNDIYPRNIGANGKIFDPVIQPGLWPFEAAKYIAPAYFAYKGAQAYQGH